MTFTEPQRDEPLSPAGRLFVQPETEQIINSAFFFNSNIDIPNFTTAVESSPFVQHPRFRSLLVRDKNGTEKWRKTELNLNQHIIVIKDAECFDHHDSPDDDNEEKKLTSQVNTYLADLSVSSPLSLDKPLWEMHILEPHNCVILRIHHALGDGISLMSLFLASCRRSDDPELLPTIMNPTANARRTRRSLMDLIKIVWFTIVFVLRFTGRALGIIKDAQTVVSGGSGVELWPRKLATARFLIDDMKMVKQAIPNATINDVLFGIISLGLSRYLELHSPKPLSEGLQLTGMAMVNLRKQHGLQELTDMMNSKSKSRWGNKFGVILLPVYYHKAGADPLQYMARAKAMLDLKKQSLEAQFSYLIGDFVMSVFGAKVASWFNYRVVCNTTFTISNVIGPKEEMTFGGNTITSIRVNSTGLPHAITMHMVSYAGKAEMQILTPKDIIPDPEVLAQFFEDALAQMKGCVVTKLAGKTLVQ